MFLLNTYMATCLWTPCFLEFLDTPKHVVLDTIMVRNSARTMCWFGPAPAVGAVGVREEAIVVYRLLLLHILSLGV